jgi:hypothetical protein
MLIRPWTLELRHRPPFSSVKARVIGTSQRVYSGLTNTDLNSHVIGPSVLHKHTDLSLKYQIARTHTDRAKKSVGGSGGCQTPVHPARSEASHVRHRLTSAACCRVYNV